MSTWIHALIGIALATLVIVEVPLGDFATPGLTAVSGVIGALATITRRRWPVSSAATAFGAHLILVFVNGLRGLGTDSPGATILAGILLAYALGRWASPRQALPTAAFGVGVVILDGLLQPDKAVAAALLADPIPWILVGLAGALMRHRGEARTQQMEQVRLTERNDLAREVHDVVAHHVSAIAVQADAALAVSDDDPAAARQALEAIHRTAILSLDEMRAMVGVLRGPEGAPLAPTGGSGDLQRLVANQPAHPHVELHTSERIDDLPATTAAAVYRLVQESVTNARRHARDADHVLIDVTVHDEPGRVSVVVTDDGAHRPVRAGGFGLTGMRERAESLGGTFDAGPRPGRGWEVRAELPIGGRG